MTVFERNDVVGGKLASLGRDGYTFDIGPSLITLPHVFDELFRPAGTTLADEVDLVRLDPQFRYRWRDGSDLDSSTTRRDGRGVRRASREGAGDAWRAFDQRGGGSGTSPSARSSPARCRNPLALARRMRSPTDLAAIDPFRTLDRSAGPLRRPAAGPVGRPVRHLFRFVAVPRAGHAGLHPLRRGSATVAGTHAAGWPRCAGRWPAVAERPRGDHPHRRRGGLDRRIGTAGRRRRPRRRARHDADVVVANTDADHLYAELLADPPRSRRVRRAPSGRRAGSRCARRRGLTPSDRPPQRVVLGR